MDDPGIYLEKLSTFSRLLRGEGLAVSPRETEDACRVLLMLGMEDREQVKTALRTVYAKSREEQKSFDRVFDGFFLSEQAMRARAEQQLRQELAVDRLLRQAEEDLKLNGQPMDFGEDQKNAYAAMTEAQKQRLREIKEKYAQSAARNPELYTNFIHSVFARSILEQQMATEEAGDAGMAADPEMGLMYREISEFKDTEIPKAIRIIQNVARQINGELSAKRKRGGRSSQLDFRRTIRKGLETGGSLYRLKYRRSRSRRKRLVLLCDVSGSMVQFSEFALRFIQSLNRISDSSRVFLFSTELYEADAFGLQNMDRFRSLVRKSGLYGKGTDLGSALEKLLSMHPSPLGTGTTLLILSDTKTVGQNRAVAALKEAKRTCGQVLILNPIPQNKWKYIRSCQIFGGLVNMVPCATLRDLAEACRRLSAK